MRRGKYTVNEVEERTRVPGSTLRQWERRYGFPKPERSEAGYRLYSDLDLGHIDAMKRHIAEGIPASRAAELVRGVEAPTGATRSLTNLQEELVASLVGLDEESAGRIIGEAFSLHPLESVVLQLFTGSLVRMGELWRSGTVEAAVVHAGAAYLQGRLYALHTQAPANRTAPLVLVAGAPGNRHELGPLMLAFMLRRSGYRVHFLGGDAHPADLAALSRRLRPAAVMLSVASGESLDELQQQREALRSMAPLLALGGQALNRVPEAAAALGGTYLGSTIAQGIERFRQQLAPQSAPNERPL